MQILAIEITLLLLLVVIAAFAWVLTHTRDAVPAEQVSVPAYRLRAKLFWGVALVGLGLTIMTLRPWPHDALAAEVTRSIDVTGRQWSWELSDSDVRVGEVIEFRVSSVDVNHDLALYGPDRRIITQIQAMPGFVNRVRHRFERPGRYELLCLEYCGVAHHAMIAALRVQPVSAN